MVWLLPLMAFTTQNGSDWDSVSKRGRPFAETTRPQILTEGPLR